jgi:GDP-L-fucose synthase
MLDLTRERIVVTGGAGFLGRHVCEVLRARGVEADCLIVPRRKDYDLTDAAAVQRLYADARPTVVLHLAAQVGGIGANRAHPGRFFYANLAMGLHLIEAARQKGLRKFVQVGTVCAYPKSAPVPFKEENLWDGYPEETNAPYGVAKKALFVMLDAYQREYDLASAVVVPVNLYGPYDNFNPASSHVIPALIRKCEEARRRGDGTLTAWGTGAASREFLYVSDAARGIVAAAERMEEPLPINLGTGKEIAIRDLANLIARLCGYTGRIEWDAGQPDGQPRRCLDVTRARNLLDWQAEVDFEEGLRRTIEWYRQQRYDDPSA